MSRLSILIALAAVALLAAAPSPLAARGSDRHLWATVNVCDTAARPDVLGVRASMPGDGSRARMYMRFRAQFLDPATGGFANVYSSRWTRVGTARSKRRESGFSFTFDPPSEGRSWILRGRVEFEWRERRRRRGRLRTVVVRRATRMTETGHPSSAGSDPVGFSAALCELR
jgi:hypothetical protein